MTDRKKIKDFESGVYLGIDGISAVPTAIQEIHTRPRTFTKTGTENAATNVAESPMFFLKNRSRNRPMTIVTTANVATHNTDYIVVNFYKRLSGTSVRLGSWNTHGGAQGAMTALEPSRILTTATGLVTNSDAEIATLSVLTYDIKKYGNGQEFPALSVFSFGMEEI